ncbi:unnamed protein product [Closterium sp. Naga37s-1]|nr:unnamed protein product [Closterium sp. Naga37s-1]
MRGLRLCHASPSSFIRGTTDAARPTDLPVLSCPLTRFKRQRPPTIDIPRKGCFTSSPAGTPDSAAEDALDGVVEVAESGACFAVACKRGRKAVMEDTYQALMGFAGRESDAFFGVFDGHGGTAAAKFAASELASHVAQAAARTGAHASAAALMEGYMEADRRFLDQNVTSGTSCLTCWATPGRLLLAHAGDCKAVLVKGGRAVALTEDHRASREDEQARITSLGGFVDTATGMPRVQGILAVTRGMGERFKRQRPPTIDIPRKGCFTSSPAGTPDSAAEDALDGVVEVAESGACFAVACKRGRKAVMEDTYQALMGFAGRESDAFFGVFDGHGGTAAAKFAASELASHVAQAAARTGAHASAAALMEGYMEADRRFLDQNVTSGTSCLTCWATPGRLLLAHAGDCKAVLVKGGRAVALTEDHRASREDEQARITSLGGFVDTATGMPRVQGILAVTRGMGDAHLKAFITPQPDVAHVRVGADCSALILASDGLWDVVAPQDAADVVMACVGTALEARAAAGKAQAAEREVGLAARPPFTPPWLDAPSEPAVCVGPHAVAAEGPTTVARFPQGSVAVLVDNEESEGDGSKKVEGTFPNEMGKGDCSGGGVSEEGGSERVTRGVDGEVLLSACQALVGMAAARGSRDDITVMLVSLAPFAESAAS